METQVTTGAATTVSRINAANDVAVVTAEQLSRVPSPSLENALAGRIAGAQVIALRRPGRRQPDQDEGRHVRLRISGSSLRR